MDPGAVLFVNENLGGHASMHLSLREALPEVHPGLDADFIDVPGSGHVPAGARRAAAGARSARPRPAPAALPARAERGARRRLRPWCLPARARPDVLHMYTQSIALLQRGPAAVAAVRRLDRRDLPPGRVPPAPSPARPASPRRRCASRSASSAGSTPRPRSLVAQSEWVADCLAAGVRDRPGSHPGHPVRADRLWARSRACRQPDGLPEVTFVGATLDRKGGDAVAPGVPRAPPGPVRAQPRHPRRRRSPSPASGCTGLRARRPAAARAARPHRRCSRSRPRWTTRPYSRARGDARPVSRWWRPGSGRCPRWWRTASTGLLVTHDDATLATAIGTLLDDPARVDGDGRGRAGAVRAVYDARVTTRQLLDVLTEARERFSTLVPA